MLAPESSPPGNLSNKWTREEDEKLLEGLRIYGEGKWEDIAEKVVKTRDSGTFLSLIHFEETVSYFHSKVFTTVGKGA